MRQLLLRPSTGSAGILGASASDEEQQRGDRTILAANVPPPAGPPTITHPRPNPDIAFVIDAAINAPVMVSEGMARE